MSQRNSNYPRLKAYRTPAWVTRALFPHLPQLGAIWEPAAGDCAMADVLIETGADVHVGDIDRGDDFLTARGVPPPFVPRGLRSPYARRVAIITNPPFELAAEFIARALALTAPVRGLVAMLVRADYDHAKRRRHLFGECPAFAKKIALTRRIVWFVDPDTGKPKAAPSENHCWMVWDHEHDGPPQIAYAPEEGERDERESVTTVVTGDRHAGDAQVRAHQVDAGCDAGRAHDCHWRR